MITDHAMKPGFDYSEEFEFGLDRLFDRLKRLRDSPAPEGRPGVKPARRRPRPRVGSRERVHLLLEARLRCDENRLSRKSSAFGRVVGAAVMGALVPLATACCVVMTARSHPKEDLAAAAQAASSQSYRTDLTAAVSIGAAAQVVPQLRALNARYVVHFLVENAQRSMSDTSGAEAGKPTIFIEIQYDAHLVLIHRWWRYLLLVEWITRQSGIELCHGVSRHSHQRDRCRIKCHSTASVSSGTKPTSMQDSLSPI